MIFAIYCQNAFDFGFRKSAIVESSGLVIPAQASTTQDFMDFFAAIPLSFNQEILVNFASYPRTDYQRLSIKTLPASLTLGFWYPQDKELESSNQLPDFKFTIIFE
jgi:hypothetical protein